LPSDAATAQPSVKNNELHFLVVFASAKLQQRIHSTITNLEQHIQSLDLFYVELFRGLAFGVNAYALLNLNAQDPDRRSVPKQDGFRIQSLFGQKNARKLSAKKDMEILVLPKATMSVEELEADTSSEAVYDVLQ
jgi:hypothetical protein